ncbi:MAG: hypothetical protein LBD23_06250, partial [Oscillospiraceae bacterium]|nr:hypothetical protein [Oscillospiraceae bacterium]
TEIQIRELIENSKRPVQEWYAKYVECAADNKDLKDAYKKNYWVAIETNLNAYDEACAKYKDGKIDQVRFQKTYQAEIRNLV